MGARKGKEKLSNSKESDTILKNVMKNLGAKLIENIIWYIALSTGEFLDGINS
ncbi:hypothetical protein OH784_28520 [Ectobacillus funiculus]|uniref:hypothetical protein n=1 Tax=Ectobacillus funiculus TaxID=137993 RepID=UPI0039786571